MPSLCDIKFIFKEAKEALFIKNLKHVFSVHNLTVRCGSFQDNPGKFLYVGCFDLYSFHSDSLENVVLCMNIQVPQYQTLLNAPNFMEIQ